MSTNETQDIKVEKKGDGERHSHPAYGQIFANRRQGQKVLYGSDFVGQTVISIRIARSVTDRELSQDWRHAREELIDVELTEAQWATFVSSINVGGGVPCTISHIQGRHMPNLPNPEARQEQYKSELKETIADALKFLHKLRAALDDPKISAKKRAELNKLIDGVEREMEANIPFVVQQFDEHAEQTVEAAKVEVNAYITSALTHAGALALQGSGASVAHPSLVLAYGANTVPDVSDAGEPT